MFPRQAAETLDELALLQRRSRRSLGQPWFPLVCFGLVTTASSALVAVFGTIALVPLWVVAMVLGMLLIRSHYRHRADGVGVSGRAGPIWAVAIVMSVLCFAAGVGGGHLWGRSGGLAGPVVIVLLGHVVLGRLQRNPVPPLVVLPAATVGVALAATHRPAWLVTLAFGTLLVAGGLVLRAIEGRHVLAGANRSTRAGR